MDAGLSTMAPRNGQPSARVKLRNNLLNNDIGDIDIRNETPISRNGNDSNINVQPSSMPLQQQQQQYYRNGMNEAPMQAPLQQRQIPMQMYPQQQRQQQQYNFDYSNSPMNGIPLMQQNFTKPPPSNNRDSINGKKASSFTQSSFSNFFKHKHQFGRSKKNTRTGGGGDGDDDDEVILEDSANSDLTFNDIQTFGHKGGDKYGYGGDSTPIIPTLVTKDRGNMSNTEYRKYITNQRKTAMNAMAKQNKNGSAVSSPPRAMSLQSFPNGNPLMQAPTPHPRFQSNKIVSANYSRSNSLMSGPPGQFQQPQQQQRMPLMNNYNNRSGQFQNTPQPVMRPGQQLPQQPRTLSLTNSPMYVPRAPRPFVPHQQISQRQQQPHPVSESYRAMSLQTQNIPQEFNQWMPSDNDHKAVSLKQSISQSSNSSRNNSAHSIPNVQNKPLSAFSSLLSSTDAKAIPDSTKQGSSPLKKQVNIDQPIENKGKLNVLQLSAPQQNELKEKERKLAEMEKSLREREALIEEKEKERAERNVEENEGEETSHEPDDLNLRPTSALETGLRDLKLESETAVANRASLSTFSSTFSDSPSKQRIINTRTGMYKLENSTDINEYVTAQEFPLPGKHNLNSDNGEINTTDEAESDNNNSKRASLLQSIPERDPKRNISCATIKRRQSDDDDGKLSNINISINQENINNDTFLYKKKNRDGHLSAASNMSSSSRRSFISNTLPLNIDSASESDNFISRTDGSPAKMKTAPVNWGKDGTNAFEEDFSFDNTLAKPYEPVYARRGDMTSAESTGGENSSQSKMITISGEQLNLITENKELMNELTLVSTELAESIKRETELEERIRLYETNNSAPTFDDSSSVSFSDFEKELRKKSSKIVQLIQQLNDERLKRFIAEEQLLLQENGTKPSSIELVGRIENLNKLIDERDSEIEMLRGHLQ